MESIIANQSCN